MKRTTFLLGVIFVSLFCFNALLAQSYDLQLVLVNNDATVGGNFDVNIQIRSVGGTFALGTSNLVFTYNTSGFDPLILVWDATKGKWIAQDITSHNFSGGSYNTMDVTEPVTGRVSTNIELQSTNNGTTVSSIWMDVVTIRFKIKNPAATSGMVWRTSTPNRTVVFLDNESTEATANNLIGLDTAIPVELTMFTAEAFDGTVELKWRTETETENFGFHIYRSMAEKSDYTQINTEIIRGAGTSPQAQSYSYEDRNVQSGNTYYYKLSDVDYNGSMNFHGPISVIIEALPTEYQLEQNFPNPFNPETSISFDLKEAGKVSLKIYNLQGQLVRTLVDENKPAGRFSVKWNGMGENGSTVASGIYMYILDVNNFKQSQKLIFMR